MVANIIKAYNLTHWRIALVFIMLEIIDVATTRIGVSLGASELNPLYSVLHLSMAWFFTIKLSLVLVIAYRIATHGIAKWVLWLLFILLSLVIIANTARIFTLVYLPDIDKMLWY